jgi:hypothetical protein
MAYRTLGELRSEVMARLGMGAQGASGAAQTLINSFLRNGQAQLYRAQDWKHLTDYKDVTLGVGQNLLDYPTTGTFSTASGCARDQRILRIETEYAGEWRRLHDGIETQHWNEMDTQSFPARFERYAQLLIYPKADQLYTIRFWFVRDLLPFTEDNHAATMDDEMVLLHAVTNAKAHYRHPDATLYQGQLTTLMASLRGQSFGSGRDAVYRRQPLADLPTKPAVVGRDV